MAINAFGSWDEGLQGWEEGKTFLEQRQLMQNLEPAVSPIVGVVFTGLILLQRLSNLWDYLHFCMERKKNGMCI